MTRVHCLSEMRLMARVTNLRGAGVSRGMTFITSNRRVFSGKRVTRDRMIVRGWLPSRRGVALLAGLRKVCQCVVRVLRLLIICQVAVLTNFGCARVSGLMTFITGGGEMIPRERILRLHLMIK
jgi:hypothetical protein